MGEIADVIGGGTPRTNNPYNYEEGTIPWITPADLSGYTAKHIGHGERYITEKGLSACSARMLPAGTVLFSSRAPVGYVAIASNPVCTNQGFKSFVLKSEDILSDYVYWWLKGSKDLAESLASGTTFLELSGAKAKQIPIPIAPLEQQKLIVAEIEKQFSRLDEAVANLKRVKANLKRYKAAILKAAVEGKLTEAWRKQHPDVEPASKLLERILAERRAKWSGRGKYKEPAKPDTSNLLPLPERWTWASVDQLTSHITSGSRDWTRYYGRGSGTFILAQNVRLMRLDLSDRQAVDPPKSDAETVRTRVSIGDLLVTIVGAKTGEVCRIPMELVEHFVCQSVALLRPLMPASAKFMELYLASSENGQAQWKHYIYGQGRPHLSFEQLKMTAIAVPPLAEQQQIVPEVERRLSVIKELETAVEANLTRADRLRQSVLAQAFSGGLTRFQ
jgi:type I restriction enzyme S subunit